MYKTFISSAEACSGMEIHLFTSLWHMFDSSKSYFRISLSLKNLSVLNEIIMLQTEPNAEVMSSPTFPNKSLLINVPL